MRLLVALVLLAPVAANAEFYKCTGPDGRVNFTDQPCGARDTAHTLQVDPVSRARQEAEENRKALSARTDKYLAERKEKYRLRRYSSGLSIGLTKNEVLKNPIWGFPDDSNTTSTPYGVKEQWIYETDPDNQFERTYIYFVDDILTVIQD